MLDRRRLPEELVGRIAARFGADWTLEALGASGRTAAVVTEGRVLAVLKTLRADRRPEEVARALDLARARGVPCPAVAASAPVTDGWLVVFEHAEGVGADPSSERWIAAWSEAFSLLPRLASVRERIAPWDLEREWLDFVAPAAAEEPTSRRLLDRLQATSPVGVPCLAHGDFAPQNFVLQSGGCILIDWEEVGYARPGFDAGWLLSLNRIGAGPRRPQQELVRTFVELDLPASNLDWFEGLGLLRMLARARAWKQPFERELLIVSVRAAIESYNDRGVNA